MADFSCSWADFNMSIFTLLMLFFLACGSQASPCLDPNNQPITTCSQCLAQTTCEWCPFRGNDAEPAIGCVEKDTQDCPSRVIVSRPIEDHSGRPISQDGAAEEDIVQVYPQQSTLTISPNHPGEVNFQVKLAEVPVDIYFVLDISNSMSIHKHNLQKSIEQIQEEISRLTSRAMFGFGSFSDKSLPPFSSELPFYERMIQAGQRHQPPPYSFHHQMPLTDDIENFIRSVSETEQAGNVDSPEAGMDALMQVITCNEEIGWRDSVQKVIILITDEDTHFAYDGRLAGLPLPQDGQCHLDKVPRKHVFRYGMELEQDFPSFGQIRGKLKDKNMVVVFAVHPGMDAIYRELSRYIQGTENVGHLSERPQDLINLVVEQYKKIKSRIVLQVTTSHPEGINVELESDCKEQNSNNRTCSNVPQSTVVKFKARINIKQEDLCRKASDMFVEISLRGFTKDRLKVNVICEKCQCGGRPEPSAQVCHGKGNLVCGGCECQGDYFGRACQCNLKESGSSNMQDLENKCRPNGTDDSSPICNNRGGCTCGQCSCNAHSLGQFCQCSVKDCPKNALTGQACSGHGFCRCSKDVQTSCACAEGWTGENCGCSLSQESCKDDITGEICFGRGSCKCGKCQCKSGYGGRYCQKDQSLTACQKLEPCVKWYEYDPKFGGGARGAEAKQGVATQLLEYWKSECDRMMSHAGNRDLKLFDFEASVHIGCPPLQKAANGSSDASGDSSTAAIDALIYKTNQKHDCAQTLKEHAEELASLANSAGSQESAPGPVRGGGSSSRRPSSSSSSGRNGPLRGDQSSDFVERSIRQRTTKDMERCVGWHDRCEFVFFHENIEDDEYFERKSLRNVFVVHRNVSGAYQALATCYPIPMALVISSTVGTLLLIGIGLLVAVVVIVNINDLRRWQRFQAEKLENEMRLAEHSNPLFKDKPDSSTTIQNPAFGSG